MLFRAFFITVFLLFGYIKILYSQELKLTVFRQQGEGTSWSPKGDRIVYDMKGAKPKEYYEMHVADTNGAHDTCLSCLCPDIPHKETGSPDWSPNGKYIVFVSEKAIHKGPYYAAIPGFGGYSDIWVMTANGKHAWKVLETANTSDDGIIAPKFSHDGKHVVWVERKRYPHIFKKKQFFGLWQIKTADFVDSASGPKLENIKTFEPKGNAFYETYGFSADDKRIIFCSNMDVRFWWECRIYTIDATTGADIKQLTNNNYNEHARYANNGKWIIWMSNSCVTKQGTDWWVMHPDGSMKQRLTYFNEPAFPGYSGKKWAGLAAFSPDDKRFAGAVQYSLFKQEGTIYMGEFLPCDNGDGVNGEYYSDDNFSGNKKIRNDAAINFRWGPPWNDSLVIADSYSVKWTGYVKPLYTETYSFYTHDDKQMSVWLNDTLLIGPNTQSIQHNEKMAQINLMAGTKYKLRVEYSNKKSDKGTAVLIWSSLHQYKQVIPASQLFKN
jgi:Tol biopolymer transport system component